MKNRPDDGSTPPIAVWRYRGPHSRGEASKEFQKVILAAKQGAAEAITDKKIPKRYETAVKKYFGALQEGGGKE